MSAWRMAARAVVVGLVLGVAPGATFAQSAHGDSPSPTPGAAGSPGPAASHEPAACLDLLDLPPEDLGDDRLLTAEAASGVEDFDPDDMLDPFLASLGLDRDDVCSVGIRYGPAATTDLIGLLVRVRGAGTGLGEGLASALADRLREYGNEVTQESIDVPPKVATRLRIVASGAETQLLVADAASDVALVTPSQELLEALLPLVPAASPQPSG
ncbi:MAG: hypothetical protein U0667_00445 [Chloroflexota bacterium]